MGLYLGIDFGTSTNYVTRWIEETKTIEPVHLGNYGESDVFPNVIYYETKENIIVGQTALKKGKLDNENCVWAIKRHIGEIGYSKYIPNLDQKLTSVEIARDIFRWIKKKVEEQYAGEPIESVVISVPFSYQNSERQIIKAAAVNAGLNVKGLIEEPVAAAFSFGLMEQARQNQKEKILVFDLGGGTFDVTIFDFVKQGDQEFSIRVLTTGGAKKLGGIDIDNILLNRICEMMETKYANQGYKFNEIPLDKRNREASRMRDLAVELKVHLSDSEEEEVFFESHAGEDLLLDETLDVETFNQYIKAFVVRVNDVVETTLDDADLTPEDIDRIILVGGTSNIPCISESLTKLFHKIPEKIKAPDMMVGEGAGIYCGMRFVENSLKCDVTIGVSHSIGIKIKGRFEVMIPRNTPYGSNSEFQVLPIPERKRGKDLKLNIYQGVVNDNQVIGKIVISKNIQDELSVNKIAVRLTTDINDGTVLYELYEKKSDGVIGERLCHDSLKGG